MSEIEPDRPAPTLRFNVLGPLEGWADGVRMRLGGAIQERVLATLLLETGRVVTIPRLVDAAWEGEPPATATHQVRKAVADLRRRIPGGSAVILTDGPGYRVAVADDQLDLLEFGIRVRAAEQAVQEGRQRPAATELRTALALWQGAVLSGSGGPVIDAAATALEERRLAAAERLCELRLALGESAELVPDARALVTEHPLRETLRGHLMLALYRSGRQAEALEEYGKVRALLVDELGIDPGPRLARLYEDILRDSPALAAPAPQAPAAEAAVHDRAPEAGGLARDGLARDGRVRDGRVPGPQAAPDPHGVAGRQEAGSEGAAEASEAPCTLPYCLPDFTGRAKELAELLDPVAGSPPGEQSVRVVAIDGMGGVGKTALAVQAAHQLAEQFPGGQLYVDLRGFTPGEQPVPPGTVLDTLLRMAGVPGDRIPDDPAGRTQLWRATLAGRKMLLLLDNAADAEQIRPLLPASPGCLVLTTSRARLLDLDGVEWVSVGLMTAEDSAALVAETLGAARVDAEPEAAVELAELCGQLPLALRIATARLRNRPRWTVSYLVERLRDETHRLNELRSGERGVEVTLQLSYQSMDERHRAAFRLLGLHPGKRIDVRSAAALLGMDAREAEDTLELLLDVHLLQQPDIGVYTFHDLVRSFAHKLRSGVTEEDDAAAVERLLDYYLTATETACTVLFPGRVHRPTGLAAYRGELPPLDDAALAWSWFDHEHSGLVAAAPLAERHGHDRHTIGLVRNLSFYLNARGRFDEFWSLCHLAVAAARRIDDAALLCVALSNLGVACWKLGRFEEGLAIAAEGRDLAIRAGDRATQAHHESGVGMLLAVLGRFDEALPLLQRSVVLSGELGTPRAEADNLTMLSTVHDQLGQYEEAAAAARRAWDISGPLGYRENELTALTELAFAHLGLGEMGEAYDFLKRARDLCDETRPPGDVALVSALSAEVAHLCGEEAGVSDFAQRALDLVRTGGSPVRLVKVENIVGRFHMRRGEYARAQSLHAHAHKVASAMGYRSEETRALVGLGHVAEALGDRGAAAEHRAAAAELFDFMGLPECRRAW
ncbi:AfsR/SARP family transcriptional regulator [Streptomyces luteolus]|uniref:BTAD domain-containing putative transcriptional regulator n=1 Tax=Streptomyces luteolus TaxID=3043615 RepID=A0ABT6T7B7_9ACTN|nr:AfsR/SARP family transcriptional regulator [Streptomyces sp. B-S-A12]MDI3423783.1 BTAD domain-containing putative transcriptional regulator [Streptomyces sp. B-S-A12]